MKVFEIFLWVTGFSALVAGAPRFDPTAILRGILVPSDAAVGSVIYRLRASDPGFEYPLSFEIEGEITVASMETLNCTRFNSVCQANVVLMRKLEPGRFYDFRVVVRNRKNIAAVMDCSFRATNATTPIGEIFPGAPTLLMVSESSRRNTELGSLIAKGNPLREKPVLLELWGSPQFGLRQRLFNEKDAEGTIILLGGLDYEIKTVHHLTIFANDPWTEPENDSRNIAAWSLLVAVLDEQDTPPVFTQAPPTTALDPSLNPGDTILTVKAEDGDRGNPREIRYGLISEGNPFTPFFNLSEDTGELRLSRPLSEIQAISHANTPILLTVVAEEVRSTADESPAQSSTVRLALIPPPTAGGKLQFSSDKYKTEIDENSPPGTIINVQPELLTQGGLIASLELLNNNGTFEISPGVVEGRSKFVIKIKDNSLLDYEARHGVQCVILARELGDGLNHTATSKLYVKINDINDNPPQFRSEEFQAEIPENAEVGTTVVKVYASDVEGRTKSIRFDGLFGDGSEFFQIDKETGIITVRDSSGLDSERQASLKFFVQATNDEGKGQSSRAEILINLLDVNDQHPEFEKGLYEFIVDEGRRKFTVPAFITAYDKDLTSPNNEVRYELLWGVDNLTLNAVTGELLINPVWNNREVLMIKARAYDGGVPRLWTDCDIRMYPPEGNTNKIVFIVSGSNPDRRYLEEQLSEVIGGKVTVDKVRPYTGAENGALDISKGGERSVVETTVTYSKDSVIDFNRIQEILANNRVERQEISKASSNNLWWLILLILLLLLLLALILVLCCVLEGCPLYVAPKKRRKVTPSDIKRLVVKETQSGPDLESKSVQVAEWFGRREAWTPEHNLLDVENDSMRRHEVERGSDRGENRKKQENGRDHLYIREGNTDILRLITRGGEQQRPVTLIPEQTYFIDSGKDILMRRFIDQQQSEVLRTNALQQNTLNRIQSEHELLEASLRQQNALLRQILMERERDLRFETQSLPAGTQTDQNASTQTEPLFLRPPRRETRSDNDASDCSDEEERYLRARRKRNTRKAIVKRKIRTPIQEESESNYENFELQKSDNLRYAQTKSSLLRQKLSAQSQSSARLNSSRSIKKEVLQEISDSLHQSESDEKQVEGGYTSDSLDEASSVIEKTDNKRRHSENDLEETSPKPGLLHKTLSHSDLNKTTGSKPTRKKSAARYMEWYNKNSDKTVIKKSKTNPVSKKPANGDSKPAATKVSKRLLSDTQASMRKKIELPTAPKPEHPLIQHSKNRFEVTIPKRIEEDVDSGIVLSRPAMAQKKSIFTIAYDDMQTRQLPESVSTTP